MNSNLKEIDTVTEQLKSVQQALNYFKEKQLKRESVSEAAVEFVEKASLVLDRAERSEISLSEDQRRKIKNNLLKIRASLVKNQEEGR
ncbi:hypothetical protein LEP1GSC047_0994 [Leptospira inadai serovar Lyme str. 10]|uniref:Uncharacterized protein n=2 Tax=Leptospira inadai serovar Lyme TaxID=293084 RepID=V6HAA4_9LEPT|nr:hypothetical protein [Leptospira inadai]EQA35273.1 hypothetical protein LEP1GSC047_0994 [Leptospira inadai serovar Lyme str. 10]PNV74181.1 hypothetical protein BES34_015130 [Leptospira inadai serovar Lyme]